MIDPGYCRLMARYNAWQNRQMMECLQPMPAAELTRDRGAFFGSILGTLNHLLWGDRMWMSRFDGWARPESGITGSTALCPTLAAWSAERFRADGHITLWAEGVKAVQLAGNLTWLSGATGREVTKPMAQCVIHMFNHQTHHRGQVHAMLTAAGARPDDTDIPFMPNSN